MSRESQSRSIYAPNEWPTIDAVADLLKWPVARVVQVMTRFSLANHSHRPDILAQALLTFEMGSLPGMEPGAVDQQPAGANRQGGS